MIVSCQNPLWMYFCLLKRYIGKCEKNEINRSIYPIFIKHHLQIFYGGLDELEILIRGEILNYLQDKTEI